MKRSPTCGGSREFDPWWIEEPTSPDDILGHAAIRRRLAPIGVATGEHCHNRVMFKQLLQAQAIDFCQIDSCRLGGLNEVLVVLLMAAKFGVPVCPHAGGVGLCEYVQHISLFDYVCVSASLENRVLEYVDHLHEHFIDPVVISNGRYMPPQAPGLQHRDACGFARTVRVSARRGVASVSFTPRFSVPRRCPRHAAAGCNLHRRMRATW